MSVLAGPGGRVVAGDQKLDRIIVQQDLAPAEVERITAAFRTLFEGTGDAEGVLAEIVRYLPLGAIATNADGILTQAFGSVLDGLGIGDDQLVGTDVEAWGPEVATYRERVNGGHAHIFEIDGMVGDDIFRSRVFGVPDGEGGSFAIVLDLTDALAAEREVDTNRMLLESVIDSSGAWMVVQDESGTVISVNTAARAALGVDRGTADLVAAFAALDPIREDDRPFEADELPPEIVRRNQVAQTDVVMGLRSADGDRRWMNVTSTPVQLDGQRTVVTSFADRITGNLTVDVLRDSDQRFRLLAEETPMGIFIIDVHGTMLYVNPAVAELAGRSAAELRAVGWEACTHPDDLDRLAGGSGLDSIDQFEPVEYRVLRPDGSIRWVRSSGALLRDDDDTVIGLVGTAADVTAIHEAHDRLRESEARNRAIVETAAEGIVSVDEHGSIVEFNAAAERIFGHDSDDVIGASTFFDLFAEEDRELLVRYNAAYLAGDEPQLVGKGATELTGRRRDGSSVPVEVAMTQLETSAGRLFTALIRDLTQDKAFERELEHLATHDALTGLPNRTLFAAQLESALQRADRLRSSMAVLFVDIDRVKLVTEALGHRAGDELIEQAAQRLRSTVGSTATLGRFSNDQFVAFLEDQDDLSDAVDDAVRIIEAINEPFMVAADEAFVNASIGIAYAVDGLSDAETLISNADVAMGRAKESSVSRYEVWGPGWRCSARPRSRCGTGSIATSSSCTTSRSWRSRRTRSAGTRRWSGGTTRTSARWPRRPSCPSPRRAASSCPSANSSCATRSASRRRGRPMAVDAEPTSRSTCRPASSRAPTSSTWSVRRSTSSVPTPPRWPSRSPRPSCSTTSTPSCGCSTSSRASACGCPSTTSAPATRRSPTSAASRSTWSRSTGASCPRSAPAAATPPSSRWS